ncbi:MAG TPA: VOC family protein [Steroidobacteraceae bacterium]
MNDPGAEVVERLVRFSLVTHDREVLADFYERAFGFRRESAGRCPAASSYRTIVLGAEQVELLQFDQPGDSYPAANTCADVDFQHFALVVTDIAAAYQRLHAVSGWTPISRGGPVQLPQSSGGVAAFKFRDPEGHPLELIEFPSGAVPPRWRTPHRDGRCLGIDHSAISVHDTARSVAFYRALGLHEIQRTLNRGPEQERLDALGEVRVEVTALGFAASGPHLELLCYRSPRPAAGAEADDHAVAATRLVLEMKPPAPPSTSLSAHALVDPDGHRLLMQAG